MTNSSGRHGRWLTVTAVLLTAVVVGVVLWQLDWMQAHKLFQQLDGRYLLAGFLVFLGSYGLRALRFRLLIFSQPVGYTQTLGVTMLHGMYNYLMPARSGEFSILFLLRRQFGIAVSESASTLFLARYFDFAVVALMLPLVLIFYWSALPTWLRTASLLFLLVLAVMTLAGRKWVTALANQPINGEKPAGFWPVIRYGIATIRQTLQIMLRQRQSLWLMLLTMGIWLGVYTNFYFIVLSLGYELTFLQMVVVSIIMIPMTLLPLQGFANIGTHEIGWIVAFRLFGYGEEVALAIAVGSHVILLFFVLLLGLMGAAFSMYARLSEG